MVLVPVLKSALGDLAGTVAVATIEPNERRFWPKDHSLAITVWAPDLNSIKIVCGLVHLKAADEEAKLSAASANAKIS